MGGLHPRAFRDPVASSHFVTGNDVDGKNNRAALDIPVRVAFHKLPSFVKLLTANGHLTHQSGKWWEGSFEDGGFTHGMTHSDPKRGDRRGGEGLTVGREEMKPITDSRKRRNPPDQYFTHRTCRISAACHDPRLLF